MHVLRSCGAAFVLLVAAAFASAQAPLGPLGGAGTVADASARAFGFPSPLLAAADRRAFAVGNALFRANWIAAPASARGLDGLGPLFHARSCSSCHLHDGRSRPPESGDADRSGLLLRIGVRRAGAADAPHPVYGAQLQDAAVPGVAPEARVRIHWRPTTGVYGDGEPFELVSPRYELTDLGYGPIGPDVVLGGRTGPQLVGLGLLEAVPADVLESLADPADDDGDGVSGRVHRLPGGAIGRFGWKATQPSVRAQTAGAFLEDMGITSPDHVHEPFPPGIRSPGADAGPEIDEHKLARVSFYAASLAVPAQRDADATAVVAGRGRFHEFGCAVCHVETLRTAGHADARFAGQTIHAFTDLLLHDLGPGLADEKHDGDAAPGEWRTAPLWGLGLVETVNGHTRFLHDGRARGFAEAILWHGGEAEAARERFRLAPRSEREALLAFLRSL